jgi:hypothetical protein
MILAQLVHHNPLNLRTTHMAVTRMAAAQRQPSPAASLLRQGQPAARRRRTGLLAAVVAAATVAAVLDATAAPWQRNAVHISSAPAPSLHFTSRGHYPSNILPAPGAPPPELQPTPSPTWAALHVPDPITNQGNLAQCGPGLALSQ